MNPPSATSSPRAYTASPFAAVLLSLALAVVLTGFAVRPSPELSPRFNHVMLHVSDLERSIDFYTRAFGVEVTQRLDEIVVTAPDGSERAAPVRMAFLKFPGQEFVLELAEQPGIVEGPTRFYQHLGVDVLDIEAAVERVQAVGVRNFSGIQTVRASGGPVARNAFFLGPDGEQLELMQMVEGEF